MDEKRLFTDAHYTEYIIEFHKFVAFVLNEINTGQEVSSCVIFPTNSSIYYNKHVFMNMLKSVFPSFDVEFGSEDGQYYIDVSWEKFVKENFK